jgi:hypothetical protein
MKHPTRPRKPTHDSFSPTAAAEEMMSLYHAWLGYLLLRLGEETLRVPVADISAALGRLRCSVSREGGEYVIRREGGGEGGACERPDQAEN